MSRCCRKGSQASRLSCFITPLAIYYSTIFHFPVCKRWWAVLTVFTFLFVIQFPQPIMQTNCSFHYIVDMIDRCDDWTPENSPTSRKNSEGVFYYTLCPSQLIVKDLFGFFNKSSWKGAHHKPFQWERLITDKDVGQGLSIYVAWRRKIYFSCI